MREGRVDFAATLSRKRAAFGHDETHRRGHGLFGGLAKSNGAILPLMASGALALGGLKTLGFLKSAHFWPRRPLTWVPVQSQRASMIAARYFMIRRTFTGRDRRPAVGGYRGRHSARVARSADGDIGGYLRAERGKDSRIRTMPCFKTCGLGHVDLVGGEGQLGETA